MNQFLIELFEIQARFSTRSTVGKKNLNIILPDTLYFHPQDFMIIRIESHSTLA